MGTMLSLGGKYCLWKIISRCWPHCIAVLLSVCSLSVVVGVSQLRRTKWIWSQYDDMRSSRMWGGSSKAERWSMFQVSICQLLLQRASEARLEAPQKDMCPIYAEHTTEHQGDVWSWKLRGWSSQSKRWSMFLVSIDQLLLQRTSEARLETPQKRVPGPST